MVVFVSVGFEVYVKNVSVCCLLNATGYCIKVAHFYQFIEVSAME